MNQSQSSNSSCRPVTQLQTCAWIDYDSWFPANAGEPKVADANIGNKVNQIDDEDCKWAYTGICHFITISLN